MYRDMEKATKVAFCIGRIEQALPFPKARNPSYKVQVFFGDKIGMRWTSAQLPKTYPDAAKLVGRQVLGIVNFPRKNIAGFQSEFLLTGLPGKEDHQVRAVHFFGTQPEPGTVLYGWQEATEQLITWDDFTQAGCQAGQWVDYDAEKKVVKVRVSGDEGAVVEIRLSGPLTVVPKVGDKVLVFPNDSGSSWSLMCYNASKSAEIGLVPLGVDDQDQVTIGSALY